MGGPKCSHELPQKHKYRRGGNYFNHGCHYCLPQRRKFSVVVVVAARADRNNPGSRRAGKISAPCPEGVVLVCSGVTLFAVAKEPISSACPFPRRRLCLRAPLALNRLPWGFVCGGRLCLPHHSFCCGRVSLLIHVAPLFAGRVKEQSSQLRQRCREKGMMHAPLGTVSRKANDARPSRHPTFNVATVRLDLPGVA